MSGSPLAPDAAASFFLFAPGKHRVELEGDFNHWNPEADPLTPLGDGRWALRKALPPGTHTYRFRVDGSETICDPFATEIAPQHTAEPRAVVRVGGRPYAWHHPARRGRPLGELAIYEIQVADFTPEGTFRALADHLEYVRDLGITAIELMPVFGHRHAQGWGYAPAHFFAPHPRYGTPDALKALIDRAHGLGLAVLLDMVLAHTSHHHPFNRLYRYPESPWYGEGAVGGNAYGLPQLDYRKAPTRRFARRVIRHWLETYRVDGFRFDYASGIGVTDRGHGLPTLAEATRRMAPGAYRIAEHLPEAPETVLRSGMQGAWHIRASFALKALLTESERHGYRWRRLDEAIRFLEPAHEGYGERPDGMVNYAESHDEARLMRELLDAGFPESTAGRKCALAATVLATAPGPALFYHGGEWGEATAKHMDGNPLHWDRLETPGGAGLHAHHARVLELRRARPALHTGRFRLEWADNRRKCAVYRRWDKYHGDVVVVAVNFSRHNHRLHVPLGRDQRWREHFTGRRYHGRDILEAFVDGYAARVFLRRRDR